MIISGIYFNGKVSLDSLPATRKPIKVKVIFEETEPMTRVKLSDFSFRKVQAELRAYTGSFADEVIKERRESE